MSSSPWTLPSKSRVFEKKGSLTRCDGRAWPRPRTAEQTSCSPTLCGNAGTRETPRPSGRRAGTLTRAVLSATAIRYFGVWLLCVELDTGRPGMMLTLISSPGANRLAASIGIP